MNWIRTPDAEAMSKAASGLVRDVLHSRPSPLVCFSSGGSPARLYELLSSGIITSQHAIRCLGLDEWHGIDQRHPASCRHQLEHAVCNPLGIPAEHRFLFNSAARDPDLECQRMARVLREQGPVDLCILGLGRNGHLGLNEPAEALQAHAHVAHLDPLTRRHPMLEAQGISVERGMTFGMADLLAAREVILLITGKGKAGAATALLEGGITTHLPASFLHLHPKTTVILDTTVFAHE